MNTILNLVKPLLVLHFIHIQVFCSKIPHLKTDFIWAIFTTQLILRLKTSVMKRMNDNNNIEITVWEE